MEPQNIPKRIHQHWNGPKIPEKYQIWQQTFKDLNPDYEYRLWTSDEILELLKTDYPEFVDLYLGFKWDIQRYDFGRYAIMHKFGGLYADMDCCCCKSLDGILHKEIALAGHHDRDQRICNATMGSIPEHYFWPALMDNIARHYHTRMNGRYDRGNRDRVIWTTGPMALFQTRKHLELKFDLVPHYWFYPFKWGKRNLPEVTEKHYPGAFTKHYWAGSWTKL